MTKPNPRCLHCGGQIWAGRCRACRYWQKRCERCGGAFASTRSDARFCGGPCGLKDWRRRNPGWRPPIRDIVLDIVVTMRQGKDPPTQLTHLNITVPQERK